MKKRGKRGKIKRIAIKVLIALNVLMVLAAVICFAALRVLIGVPASQKAAERWRGESDMHFSQISCFIPVDNKLSLEDIYKFRSDMQTKFHEAALDVGSDNVLFVDAWSTTGKVTAATAIGTGEASVIAVGGEFFSFHPIRIVNGNYLSESDLMKDRVLLDREMAWLLFGGTDLQGMELRINGLPFLVGGVIEREEDFASWQAYTAGMGIYMSYEAYAQLDETAGIDCYELVAAEPVDGFVTSMVQTTFPLHNGEVRENSTRYSFGSLLRVAKSYGERSMQTLGVAYPYWENAARYIEDVAALLLVVGLAACLLPAVTLVALALRLLLRGKEKLEEDVLPQVKDRAQEAIRVRQRRAWEKRRGRHER